MAKPPETDVRSVEEPDVPAVVPARPPVEFYAQDRWTAQTHVRAVWNVPHDVAERVRDTLEGMAHTGPVHVVVHPSLSPPDEPVAGATEVIGDGFVIRPFNFVRV